VTRSRLAGDDEDPTLPTLDEAVTEPLPRPAFDANGIGPVDPENLDEETADAEWRAIVEGTKDATDPAFPRLPGETEGDRWRRIMAGFGPRKDRAGTPVEVPVTHGNLSAVYSAPAHAVPAGNRTPHAEGSVHFAHTEPLPILLVRSPASPSAPWVRVPRASPPFDTVRHAETLRIPRRAAAPNAAGAIPARGASVHTRHLRLAAAVTLVTAILVTAVAILHGSRRPRSSLALPSTVTSEVPLSPLVPGSLQTPPSAPPRSAPSFASPLGIAVATASTEDATRTLAPSRMGSTSPVPLGAHAHLPSALTASSLHASPPLQPPSHPPALTGPVSW
jgi:hypothetical protein